MNFNFQNLENPSPHLRLATKRTDQSDTSDVSRGNTGVSTNCIRLQHNLNITSAYHNERDGRSARVSGSWVAMSRRASERAWGTARTLAPCPRGASVSAGTRVAAGRQGSGVTAARGICGTSARRRSRPTRTSPSMIRRISRRTVCGTRTLL